MRKLDEKLLKKVLEFIEKGKGDILRLEHIRDSIKKGKELYQSDQNYLEDLFSESGLTEGKIPSKESPDSEKKLNSEDSPKDKTVDKFKEELGNNNEKIEKVEEKIDDKQKTSVSVNYKSQRKTLVLSLVVGLLGLMGVGHIYLGRLRRGVIILIIAPLSWTMILISFTILGLAEPEEDIMIATIGVLGGIEIVLGIGLFVLFIWQILNSRKLCKEYNEYLEQNGRAPW